MASLCAKEAPLDIEKCLRLLDAEGPISKKLKRFEPREEQRAMLAHILTAFNNNSIALIEAGTGTGKSLAYLLPAILAAAIWKEKIVISTQTISLQEQLLYKDLPLLIDALNLEIKVVLAKGMNNYVCLRKLDEMQFEKRLLAVQDAYMVDEIQKALEKNCSGTKSDLPFNPPHAIWELLSAEQDSCNGQECPHFSNCYYFGARKNAQDAQIVIVNHHLLLADLIVRNETQNYSNPAILPPYSRIILDEAHNLEEIASEYFAKRVGRLELMKALSKLSGEKQGKAQGRLLLLREKIQKHVPEVPPFLAAHLTLDLPARRRDLLKSIADLFTLLQEYQNAAGPKATQGEELKLRLRAPHYAAVAWQQEIIPRGRHLVDELKKFSIELCDLEEKCKELDRDRLYEFTKSILFDIKSIAKRLDVMAEHLETALLSTPNETTIRWLETTLANHSINTSIVDAALDISLLLLKHLFKPFDSVILLSATLTAQGSFDFFKESVGLTEKLLGEKELIEAKLDSPFDFQKQALLLVPKDIPEPNDPHFMPDAIEVMWDALQASQGNAFILFTSYDMLSSCFHSLEPRLKEARYHPLRQGDESRQMLLKRFVEKDRSVLFGTDSFWEGVDVAGDALRLVIIAKLPFKVPTDPMVEARSEALKQRGENSFWKLLLPQAAIKLKQGFGRLIRNKKDRGCIVCLDNRIITKNYGKFLLKSLPHCPLLEIEKKAMNQAMREFYKRTYFLTKP